MSKKRASMSSNRRGRSLSSPLVEDNFLMQAKFETLSPTVERRTIESHSSMSRNPPSCEEARGMTSSSGVSIGTLSMAAPAEMNCTGAETTTFSSGASVPISSTGMMATTISTAMTETTIYTAVLETMISIPETGATSPMATRVTTLSSVESSKIFFTAVQTTIRSTEEMARMF